MTVRQDAPQARRANLGTDAATLRQRRIDRVLKMHALQDAGAAAFDGALEWRRIAAFRNILVHNYLGIDLGTVWTIVEHDLPGLKSAISDLLETLVSESKEN